MGTSYDIYCLDCQETAGVQAGHDPIRFDELTPILEHASAIAALLPLAVHHDFYLVETWDHGVRAPIEWLAIHHTHRLRLGTGTEIDGQCAKDVRCSCCGSGKGYCRLDRDHDGACVGFWDKRA